ncbi:MAG: hypothetical protein WAW03_12455 [Anaerolineae bacterium]|uniref:hypothetical protein n=1 Tax=Candidatus Amarolinea dominans TaxID=3140696 RepID=UPI003134E6E5|nr:hypothetical protein [Anaerolineae bacterium]MBK9229829.1 hypothetical protein [Anaerolineae bacterium]
MILEQVATRLNTTPAQLERDSLQLYLERKLRLVESELFTLAHRYGVRTVAELDQAVQAGRFHEPEAFDDTFRFDYLEDQRHILLEMMGQL